MRQFRLPRAVTVVAVIGVVVLAAVAGFTLVGSGQSRASSTGSAQTPRTPDGKPDLTGLWNGRGDGGGANIPGFTNRVESDGDIERLFPSRRCAPNQQGCRDNTNQANDYEFTFRYDPNRPFYKPEYWDRVQFLDYDTNFSDPMMRCVPLGVPRVGPPTRILQTANDVVFLYSNRDHDYRIIPTNGRQHDPNAFPSFYGDAVGRWEGDTLVIRSVGFTDQTWIASGIEGGGGGYLHSFEMAVTERLRREGNILHYQATVEDPEVLLEPWTMNAYQLRLNTDPNAKIPEGLPCRDYDIEVAVSRIRH